MTRDGLVRGVRIAVLLVVVVLVNLPLARAVWAEWRLHADGREVTARVASVVDKPGARFVTFTLPASVDPTRTTRGAEVDEATIRSAVATHTVRVRVLPGHHTTYAVHGQVRHYTALVATLAVDVVLAALVVLGWRVGWQRRRPRLRGVALGDVEWGEPGPLLERVDGEVYRIRGRLSGIRPDRVVIDLGDRDVEVILSGHACGVPDRRQGQVEVRLVG
jgi:hypothetical protein